MSNDPFDIIEDDRPTDAEEESPDDHNALADEHLNSNHIKTILAEKKALYRHGTYMTIIAAVLAIVAVQLVWMAFSDRHTHDKIRTASFVVIAIGLVVFSLRFVGKALDSHHEAEATILPEPTSEPDFSTLSDGSQFAENLKQLQADKFSEDDLSDPSPSGRG